MNDRYNLKNTRNLDRKSLWNSVIFCRLHFFPSWNEIRLSVGYGMFYWHVFHKETWVFWEKRISEEDRFPKYHLMRMPVCFTSFLGVLPWGVFTPNSESRLSSSATVGVNFRVISAKSLRQMNWMRIAWPFVSSPWTRCQDQSVVQTTV